MAAPALGEPTGEKCSSEKHIPCQSESLNMTKKMIKEPVLETVFPWSMAQACEFLANPSTKQL